MDRLSVRELKRNASTVAVEAALWLQLEKNDGKETRQGKTYRELVFTDGMDPLTLRVWADSPMSVRAEALVAPCFLEISGQWVDRGQFGLEPLHWDFRTLDAEEIASLLEGPAELREKQRNDYAYLECRVAAMVDPRLRTLCEAFLSEHGERMRRTAAAREYHHARRGGLVEHVAQMMRAAWALLGVYPNVNKDLVIAGVLFHDCGKLWENCYVPGGFTMPFNEVGELISHIPLGIEVMSRLWRALEEAHAEAWAGLTPTSDQVKLHLIHLIASHHGTLEFGSPVVPKTPEAMLLHFVDNIDAKLEMFAEGYEKSALLSKTIHERRRPLFHTIVRPLPAFEPPPIEAEEGVEIVGESLPPEAESGAAS